jgi:hypothetical protein
MQQALGQTPSSEQSSLPPRPQGGRDRPKVRWPFTVDCELTGRTRNHSYHHLALALERGIDHQEEIKGVEEVEEGGNKDGNHLECKMGVMGQEEVIRMVEEEDMVMEDEVDMVMEDEVDMEARTETTDYQVKVDGNHVEGMMALLHLVDLGLEVQQGGRGIDLLRHLDVDHLVHHLEDETTHHLEDDEERIHHLDEPLHLDGAGTIVLHHDVGTILPQLGKGETIPPHLEVKVKPKRTIHPQEDVGMIHHRVELVISLGLGPDRDHQLIHRLGDVAGALVQAELGLHHLKLGGGGAQLRRQLVHLLLRMMRWTRQMDRALGTELGLRMRRWQRRAADSRRRKRPEN